jgi:hypothetical protein
MPAIATLMPAKMPRMPAIGRVWRSDAAIAPFTQDHCSVAGNAAEDKIAPWNSEGAKMEEPVEERKEHLRDAAAADVVELKDAVAEFTAAAVRSRPSFRTTRCSRSRRSWRLAMPSGG